LLRHRRVRAVDDGRLLFRRGARAAPERIPVRHRRDRADLVRGADAPGVVRGFGVREATFSIYFSRIGQPIESAIAMSLVGQR